MRITATILCLLLGTAAALPDLDSRRIRHVCAGALDNLYERIQDQKRWCQNPKDKLCPVGKANCRKLQCVDACKVEGRTCSPTCPP
ncbi:unnamed protein product [Clonostachys rhizophaga]|uniref:Uncharacterized protein n=1 Tax=Clonostachys rhizophaga TaxID=160324 RepID=A0A9N9VJ28_9HYPO|nr:unnamed protein product [Clonostachys rhizophaga]